jgi:hypothetical protein
MEVIGLATIIALIWKLVDFLKAVTNWDTNAITTQATVWVAAVAVMLLARETEPFRSVAILGGQTVGSMNVAAIVLFALGLGSAGSVAFDYKKAFDGTDSAKTASLLPGPSPQD